MDRASAVDEVANLIDHFLCAVGGALVCIALSLGLRILVWLIKNLPSHTALVAAGGGRLRFSVVKIGWAVALS